MDKVKKDRPMPPLWWAVICTIRQDAEYRFVGSEYTQAQRMVKEGMLVAKDDRRYVVTPYGQRCYMANKVLASKN
ncbi:hypothetical protein KTD31_02030 [Burkholderia multivorans]|jgi:hypothetical protein|uniref:hypothetical protein n=1 Tax=Burkholderia multivorans TaxID=87883 RepID=UPI001C23CC6A|nr:hypothetical protein [Burkholderia multivorans]MBU9200183.1 hypothetical protein [Burkholderia multivorans]